MMLLTISRSSVELIATVCLSVVGIYLLLGLLFYGVFVAKGIARVDESVEGSPKTFLLLLLPGTLAFWPVLLTKWIRAVKHPSHD